MIRKLLNILLIVLLAITFTILGMFIFGGDVPNQLYPTPVYTSLLLNWAFALIIIAAIVALAFPIARLATRPAQALKTLIPIVLFAIIVLIAYFMADGTPMKIVGYSGTDNVPSHLIFTDTVLKTMYILFGLAVLSIFGSELYRKFR